MKKTAQDFADAFARQAADEVESDFHRVFQFLSRRCESPIEEVLLAALIYMVNFENPQEYAFAPHITWPDGDYACDEHYLFDLQVDVGEYRADFVIFIRPTRKWIVVECDGHDFHERTKEQAARDRSRDRWMTANGITVMRFTGAEIWRDPAKCADEINRQIGRLAS